MRKIDVDVDIDEAGVVRPIDSGVALPQDKAAPYWPEDGYLHHPLMSGKSFEDWLSPEEDAAWAHLQPKS